MEWLTEKKVLATRDISSNSAGETEELIERQEKVIDQLDKKGKVTLLLCYSGKNVQIPSLTFICQVFREIVSKGSKLKDDPKSPVFLGLEVKRASDLWEETNSVAMDRLNRLRGEHFLWAPSESILLLFLFLDNLSAWERYENKRNDLGKK